MYDDITDGKTLGSFLNFVHNCEIRKENFIKVIPHCDANTRINFHMSALLSNCGGKRAISPFDEFDTISISLEKESRKIWYVEKKATLTVSLSKIME